MPEVDNQDQSSLISIVPGLVLKTVVEDVGFSLLLKSGLFSDPHATPAHANEREVEPELFVCGSIVRGNVGAGGERADERMMVEIGDVLLEKGHSQWYFLAVVVKFHIV